MDDGRPEAASLMPRRAVGQMVEDVCQEAFKMRHTGCAAWPRTKRECSYPR
jgi:hypothetical protein